MITPAFYRAELEALLTQVEQGRGKQSESVQTLPARHYTCPVRHAAERALFARMPLIVAHSSQLAQPGDYYVNDDLGKSWLLVRGEDGAVRGFLNYCQHRGTRLVAEKGPGGGARRFNCPYHGWSYDTTGRLAGVPREDLFPCLDRSTKSLRQGRVFERCGLVWLVQDPGVEIDIDEFLGELQRDLAALERDCGAVWYDQTRELRCNWKLPLDAFLESYHIAVLHRDSIAPYFCKNIADSTECGLHTRSLVPRSNALELRGRTDWDSIDIRDYVSPSYIVFPNTCFVLHPSSVSVMSVYPGRVPGEASWNHRLLIPHMPRSQRESAHYDKTIRILDGMTFAGEDFWVSEQIQQGLDAGAIDELTLGLTEGAIREFHARVEAMLEQQPSRH
jgi:phenylpropionate dioxygenase-like ring-hydroxylating dioxygenase large terminal subunit